MENINICLNDPIRTKKYPTDISFISPCFMMIRALNSFDRKQIEINSLATVDSLLRIYFLSFFVLGLYS